MCGKGNVNLWFGTSEIESPCFRTRREMQYKGEHSLGYEELEVSGIIEPSIQDTDEAQKDREVIPWQLHHSQKTSH